MSVIGSNILAGASGQAGYNLTNSLRFRASASAYLNRTFASAGNQKTWTWSAWVKRGSLSTGTSQNLFGVIDLSVTNRQNYLTFQTDNTLAFYNYTTSGYNYQLITTQVFRDPSAWYHIVCVSDTTQATSSNRLKMYVNGTQITAFGTASYPSQNFDGWISGNTGSSVELGIGRVVPYNTSEYFDGYLAEVNFIDGQALTPSSFGETSATTGVWIPKKYTGTYGTNGFYLPFTDNSALTTSSNVGLGKDFSGNSNYFATNNISITAGSTYDSMTDVPTLTSATAANYATFNPLNSANNGTLGGGNLNIDSNSGSASAQTTAGTMSMKSGKYYFEYTRVQSSNDTRFGIIRDDKFISGSNVGLSASEYGYYVISSGTLSVDGTTTSSWITAFSQGDVGMIAYDADTGKVWFGRNGTWGGSGDPAAGTNPAATVNSFATYGYTAWVRVIGGGSPAIEQGAINFGQRPFAYTPPTGFNRLNTFNLTTPTIGATASSQADNYFNAVTYTGTSGTQAVTGVGFQPDFVWIKNRTSTLSHVLQDAVRGTTAYLVSNATTAENTNTANDWFRSFNSDGFTVATLTTGSVSTNEWNNTGYNYVSWNWRASNATAVTNTNGTITSTVSANTTAGFSIVTYSANGSTGTVGHGLGVTPSMIIVKKRNATERWCVFHTATSNAYIYLNETFAAETANAQNRFGNNSSVVQPTSTLFTIGSSNDVNGTSGTYVAYCFTQVAGYSAFGSYTGNGSSDGTFIFTGFRPAFILVKRTDSTGNWCLFDNKRLGYNGTSASKELYPNLSLSEGTSNGPDQLSNGFKFRDTYSDVNGSGATYIYMAFCESPFKYSNAR